MLSDVVSSVFLESLQQNYSWLAESVQTKQASDITDFSETSHLNDILLKGGVPHPPSFSIARAREVGISTHIYTYLHAGYLLYLLAAGGHQARVVGAGAGPLPHPARHARLRQERPRRGVCQVGYLDIDICYI